MHCFLWFYVNDLNSPNSRITCVASRNVSTSNGATSDGEIIESQCLDFKYLPRRNNIVGISPIPKEVHSSTEVDLLFRENLRSHVSSFQSTRSFSNLLPD